MARQLPGLTHLYFNIAPAVGFTPNYEAAAVTMIQTTPPVPAWEGFATVGGSSLRWTAGFDQINNQIQIQLFQPGDPIPRLFVQNHEYEGPYPNFDTGILEMTSNTVAITGATVVRWTL